MGAFMTGVRNGLHAPGRRTLIPAGFEQVDILEHSPRYVQSFTRHQDFHKVLMEECRTTSPSATAVICAACGAHLEV